MPCCRPLRFAVRSILVSLLLLVLLGPAPALADSFLYVVPAEGTPGSFSLLTGERYSLQVEVGGLCALLPFGTVVPAGAHLDLRQLAGEAVGDDASPLDIRNALPGAPRVLTVQLPEIDCGDRHFVEYSASAPLQEGIHYAAACFRPLRVDGEPLFDSAIERCMFPVTLQVSARPRPDLVVTPLVALSGTPGPNRDNRVAVTGGRVRLVATVRNIGQAESAPTTVTFFADGLPMVEGGEDVRLEAPLLAPGAVADLSTTVAAPERTGVHRYIACADLARTSEEGAQPEHFVDNNCSREAQLEVAAAQRSRADLEKFDVRPARTRVDGELQLIARVLNPGSAASSPAMVSFYRSRDRELSTDDILVGSAPVASLQGGEAQVLTLSVAAPQERGEHFYGACIGSRCFSDLRRVEVER